MRCAVSSGKGSLLPTKIEFQDEARAEIIEAKEFYRLGSVQKAVHFATRLEQALAMVAEFPRIGEPHKHRTRRVLVPDFPYWLIYRQSSAVVRVIACAHAKRRGAYWRARD